MKVAFLGNPEFSIPSLEALHQNHQITFIATSPDRPACRGMKLQQPAVKIWGESHGIPVHQVEKLDRSMESMFRNLDAGIVVASCFFVPGWLLKRPGFGFLNLHPSLLPKYRGPSPVAYALLNSDKTTGVSIIKLSSKLDAGPILLQREVEISPIEYRPVLEERLSRMGAKMLLETLDLFETGKIQPREQDESLATHAPLLIKEDGIIDFFRSAQQINDQIRALTPWPGCFTNYLGCPLKITAARVHSSEKSPHQPGLVFSAQKENLLVACGSGVLEILKLQMPSKKETEAWAFVCGYKIEGTVLG
ncbi:MAG: methionyl-tRNA formyltransferase [Candidatus Wallbacteria bacterium]|nr:methionyl-tRNA formyltransferase [Candidatus Wallbacteria bacterium]